MNKSNKESVQIYQIKVTVEGTEEPVWRRILVPDNISLRRLYEIIDMVVGWEEAWLYRFIVNGKSYGKDFSDDMYYTVLTKGKVHEEDILGDYSKRLYDAARESDMHFKLEYMYPEHWVHDILIEKASPPESGQQYPFYIGGEGECPDEYEALPDKKMTNERLSRMRIYLDKKRPATKGKR